MRYIFTLVLSLYCLSAFGQNSTNYVDVVLNTSMGFTVSTVANTEGDHNMAGAFKVTFRNEQKTREIYARISATTHPTAYTPTSPYPIKLQWTSDNSTNESNLITTALQLTSTDQRLFTQVKKSNFLFQFNYDLVYMATNYVFTPGDYSFTITFTMTPP